MEKPGWGRGEVHTKGIAASSQLECAHTCNPMWTLRSCTQMLLHMYLHPIMGHLFMPHTHVTCMPTCADTYRYKCELPPGAAVPVEPPGLSPCFSSSAEGKPGVSLPLGVYPSHPSDQTPSWPPLHDLGIDKMWQEMWGWAGSPRHHLHPVIDELRPTAPCSPQFPPPLSRWGGFPLLTALVFL